MKKYSKKGQLPMDMLILIILLFAFIVVGVVSSLMAKNINDDIQLDNDFGDDSKAVVENISHDMPLWYDNAFVFILAMLWMGMLISSWFLDTHPAFFIITLILMVIIFIIGGMLSSAYEEISGDSEFSDTASLLVKTNWIMDHWLILSIVIGVTCMIALYSKFGGG